MIGRLQSFRSPALDLAMKGFSSLGNETFFVLLFPFVYWCLDSRLGLQLAVAYSLSGYLNYALKNAFAQPRPAELSPGIALVQASGYGLPSGHAQGAVVLWGLVAWQAHRRWAWIPAVFLMLAVGLSRVYLGVHFPTDVLAGWALGALVLGAAMLAPRASRRRPSRELPAPGGEPRDPAALDPAAPHPEPQASSRARRGFPWWAGIPAVSLLAGIALLFLPEKDTVTMVAALWGFAAGYLLRRRFFPGGEEGGTAQRLLRLPAGLAVLLGLYLGLKALFPGEGQALYLPLRFARYALIGIWAALGAPVLFRLIGLARPAPRI